MGVNDELSNKISSSRILEEHSYYKMLKTTSLGSNQNGIDTENLVNGNDNKADSQGCCITNDKRFKKKARVEDIITNLKKGRSVVRKKSKMESISSFASMCTIREERDDIELTDLPPLKKTSELLEPEPKRDNNGEVHLQAGEQTKSTLNSAAYRSNYNLAGSKAFANQIMYISNPPQTPSCSSGGTNASANQVIYVGSRPPTLSCSTNSIAPTNPVVFISSPRQTVPCSSSTMSPVKQVMFLNTSPQSVPSSTNSTPLGNQVIYIRSPPPTPGSSNVKTPVSQVMYIANPLQTTTGTKIPVDQVKSQQVYSGNVQKQDRQQMPLLVNKLASGSIVNNGTVSYGPSILNKSTHHSNNPSQPQKQLLLITRPGNPVCLNHNSKTHENQTEKKETRSGQLNSRNSNVTKPSSGTEVNSDAPLITVQYNLPYPNNACKIVPNPASRRTYIGAPAHTTASLDNLKCNERMSSFDSNPAEIRGTTKPVEIPVSFAGNQAAYVTTISDEPELLVGRQTDFVPSFVSGPSPKSFSPRKNPKKRSAGASSVGMRNNSLLSGKYSAQGNLGNMQTNKGGTTRKTKFMRPGKETFSVKKTSSLSSVRSSFPGAVDLDHISRTLSVEHSKRVQGKSMETSVRVSNRKRQQTEKAKMMDKIKTSSKGKCQPLRLRYTKRGKVKEVSQIKVKAEVLSHTESPSVMTTANAGSSGKSGHEKGNELPNNAPESEAASATVKNSTKETDDHGNLFRDPALLTREERALQRALLMFQELEAKQSRKAETKKEDKSIRKSKRNIHPEICLMKMARNPRSLGKRKLVSKANGNTFVKRRKIQAEKQSLQKKAMKIPNKCSAKVQQNAGGEPIVKKRRVQFNENVVKRPAENIKKGSEHKAARVEDKVCSSMVRESKKIKPVKDFSNLQQHVKSSLPKVQESKSPKPTDTSAERHRVKTYMLIQSYRGFQDFSPVVLGSRTRNKKSDQVKTEKDDDVTPVEKDDGPKKDIPLLVIETVNNKPVKQNVVAKDEELRHLVKNSLLQQGMLKKEFELSKKIDDAEQFENREKRNIQVNRNTGETVLHKASRMGYDETVYHSIHQGCDSNAKDNAGWTPLHEACSRGHPNVVKVLVKYNADVNACSNDGIRPIHDAADNGNTDVLRLLIAYGADPLLSTYSGRSCVDCAKTVKGKDYISSCIGDLFLTDERNTTVPLDYEDRWEFRGSSLLDKESKYMHDIFDDVPKQESNTSVEFEWSHVPHLPTYNLPVLKDGVVIGRRNYVKLKDLHETVGKSWNTLVRMLKRTEIRHISRSEFSKEVAKTTCGKLVEPSQGSSQEEENIELVPLNLNVRSLLKIKTEHLTL